mgnify:CR=1 FL=1|tara:strand:- start:3020 stop:3247 length:228 start_codon:yes stop_codon:yes gene_type:complete
MLIPVRCFTCGALVGSKYETFKQKVMDGNSPDDVLDELGLPKYCCRRMILSNEDIIDQILPYYDNLARKKSENEF